MKATGCFSWLFLVFITMLAIRLPAEVRYTDLNSYARAHRSDVTSLEYDIVRALQKENIALSGLFPTATINGVKQQQRGDFWPDAQVTLSLTQSIYETAGPLTEWLLAQTETELARWSKENLLDDTRYEVGQNFLSYRNALLKEPLNTALDTSSKEQFEKAKTDYSQGLISRVEFEKEQANFETAQSKVMSYTNEVSITKEGLALASERPIDGPVRPVDSLIFYHHLVEGLKPYKPGDFVIEALSCRKELKVIDQQIAAATINKDIARYSYVPTIEFVADIAHVWGPPIYESTHPYRFGLSFNWNFDLGNLFRFRSAEADRLKAVFDRKRSEFAIENEVRTDCDQLEILTKDVVAVKEKTNAARITFERSKKEHEIGLLSDVDFKKAQTEWEQAQFNLEDTITKAGQKHEELLWATGYPKAQVSCFDLVEKIL